MSIETYFLYFLKENSNKSKIDQELSQLDRKPTWHTDETCFSLLHGERYESVKMSEPLRRVRLCIGDLPERVFKYLQSPAYAYPEVGQSISSLSGTQIANDEGSILISFEDYTPSDPRLSEQRDAESDNVMAEISAMLAVDNWFNQNSTLEEELNLVKDPIELETRLREVPELSPYISILKKIDYFKRRIEGTLFAPKPMDPG